MFGQSKIKRAGSKSARNRFRSGAAAVEFSVCLPLLVSLVFGSIECANAIFLQQALTSAAYEAGSVASAIGGTSDTGISQANSVLSSLGINSATVTISPTVTSTTPIGTTIVVSCSAPLNVNTATSWCLGNRTLTANFTIPKL